VIKISAKKARVSKKEPAKKKVVKRAKPVSSLSSYEVTIKSKALGEAPHEYHFVLRDGRKLRNLFELVDELESMHEDVFRHHVNESRNDFSNWIRDVFESPDLAKELHRMENRLEMQRALIRRLVKEVMELKK